MIVDLRSDTVTVPTPAMRAAMAAAAVGDDVFGEDPEVNALEREVADLLGKDAGVYVPSGTMANQIAIRLLTQPGDEVILEASAHPFLYEAGGPAVISGVTLRLVPGVRGVLDPDDVRAAVRPPNVHHATPTLLSVENTANRGGGSVVTVARARALAEVAREAGLRTHLDGARLWNAHVATGSPLQDLAAPFDVVNVCFSKGLGAPVGSVLACAAEHAPRARRIRKMLGGGMRQAGILAAACRHALVHHLPLLAEDHRRARALAEGLVAMGWEIVPPETNLLYVRCADAHATVAHLASHGVRAIALAHDQVRLVTHLQVDDAGIAHTFEAFSSAPLPRARGAR
jgi:threonine aldolase